MSFSHESTIKFSRRPSVMVLRSLFLIIVSLETVLSDVVLATGNVTPIFKAMLRTGNTDCKPLILTTFNTVDKLHFPI